MAQRIIYWFRNDLRILDNEALFSAIEAASEIIPIYVFDPRQFEKTRLGFRRTGALRAQFLIESVIDLRNRLRQKGGDLLIRIGEPEKIISKLAEDCNADYIYTSKEIAPEETRIESSLSKNLKLVNVDIKLFWMDTLVHAKDLPFSIAKLPSGSSDFLLQMKAQIHDPLPEPGHLILPQEYEAGIVPSLPMLGIDPQEDGLSANLARLPTRGGESAALAAFTEYIGHNKLAKPGDDVETEPLTDSRLSDWLSLGCLSARYIYKTVNDQLPAGLREQVTANLLTRDYFHWTLLRYGPRLFKPSGLKHDFFQHWENDHALLEQWITGSTDDAAVNDLMKKLSSSGHLVATERRECASYLVNTLGVNWTWGAMYFESQLMDYEVSVNWGKWNNIAGVGES